VVHSPKSSEALPAGGLTDTHVGQLKHIAALLDAGGQIMLGTVKPISDAAVAHDGKRTLAMLRRRAAETIPEKVQKFCLFLASLSARRTFIYDSSFDLPFADSVLGCIDAL